MSVTGVCSTSYPSQTMFQSQIKQRRGDFLALQESLQSGDLAGAQQAFATLKQDIQAARQAQGGEPNGAQTQRRNDVQSLAQALQSGNLAGAQKAFAALQQDVQQIRQAYDHHHQHDGNMQQTIVSAGSNVDAGSSRVSATSTGNNLNIAV
jgi:hypothetical protein